MAILQPSDFFRMINVKHTEEAERVLSASLSFMQYMGVGDKFETPKVSIEKVSFDLLHIDPKIIRSESVMVETLESKKIIRFPI